MSRRFLVLLGCSLLALAGCDDDQPATSDAAPVDAALDGPEPEPDAPIVGRVEIVTPVDGAELTGADDLDGDADTGVRVQVVAEAAGADDGQVRFIVDEREYRADIVDGRASTVVALPSTARQRVRIRAEIDAAGAARVDEIEVFVDVRQVRLTVEPFPGGGCDFGAADDLDPDRAGIQGTLTVTGDGLDAVDVQVTGGPSSTVAVDGPTIEVPVTFADGRTELSLIGRAADARSATVGPLVYAARVERPTLGLETLDGVTYGLGQAERIGDRAIWRFAGRSTGLTPGATVSVVWQPPLDGFPLEAAVDDDGEFTLEPTLPGGVFWRGQVTVRAVDPCGTPTTLTTDLQLDAVTPMIRIVAPADGARLTPTLDIDADRADVQVAFRVEVTDPRPDDYALSIHCGPPDGVAEQRSRLEGDRILRSQAADGVVIGTLRAEERGELSCFVRAETGPNAPEAPRSRYRLFFDRPTFEVALPEPDGDCVTADRVEVVGIGGLLDGNDPRLTVVVVDPDGVGRDPIPLEPRGDETYGATLDRADLPDGAWILRVEGTVLGGVPVAVAPDEIAIVVDRAPPTLQWLLPTAPYVTDDDPATAGFQSAVGVRVCGAGESLAVASDVEIDGARYAEQAQVPPGDCADIELPPFTAPLTPVSFTATARDACGNEAAIRREAAIDPARISASITRPSAGAGIDAALDEAPLAAGCQVDLEGLISGPGPDARFVVCTTVGQGRADPACPGQDSALIGDCEIMGVSDAGATVRCPLTLVDGEHGLTLVAVDGERVASTPIEVRADCSPPTVTSLSVEQDLDGNGCIHRHERDNPGDAGENARVTVAFAVQGLADGASVRLRTEGGLDLGGAQVDGGRGRIAAGLPPGVHRLYLRGQDAVGNPLAEPGDVGVVLRTIEVDTRPPTPALIGLDGDICLAAADDADPSLPTLQYDLRVETGRSPGESVTARLRVDGVETRTRDGELDRIDLRANLIDGARALAVTVTDACGNVGSVAGFETADGLPDWRVPVPVPVRVDTVPPGLAILGVDDGAVLEAGDDADGDPSNGFQLDVAVEIDNRAPVETGLAVHLDVDGAPAAAEPLTVPADFDGLLPARLTLSGGAQEIVARSTDACGNTGTSPPVALTVDVQGCASRIVGFDDNPQVIGRADPLTVEGQVDLVDLTCAGAPARLVVDGAPGPMAAVGDDGRVRFDGVLLDPGAHTLTLRVGPVREVTLDSPAQQIVIDTLGSTVVIARPAGPDPASLITDDRPDLDGQQTTIVVDITEDRVDSPRRARLTIGGRAAGAVDVPDASPTTVEFRDVTVPAGDQILEVCVIDGAANVGCGRRIVDADPAPPGTVAPVAVQIVDPRATEVALRFVAPGDDGAVGSVEGYAVRRADTPFVDEADWAAAAASEAILPANVAAGGEETLVLRGPGPDPIDGLALEAVHAVAIRALDDAGQIGPLASVQVDLRLRTAEGGLTARGGAWEAGDVINTTSPIIGVGDLDRDGFDDVVVAASQSATATGAAFVFGGDGEGLEARDLDPAPGMIDAFFGVVAAAAGDLNGDGAPDVAVQGYLDGFAGAAIALYFGCPEACDRAEVVAPDALIVTVGGRFTNSLAGVGDVWRPSGAGFDDLFVGGALAGETDAFVVAGRAAWPALPDAVRIGQGGDGADVARLTTPEGPAGVYAAGLGDLDGDGFDDLALSAGGDIDASYIFYGGPWPGAVAFVDGDDDTVRLVDPCPANGPSFGTAFVGGIDLDGDIAGRPDFAVGNRANKRIAVFDADLATLDCFGRSPVQYGRFFDLAGDIDGDGAIDLVATHGDPAVTAAHIFYNDGLGRFGVGAAISPRGAQVTLRRPAARKLGVAGAGDVDGDGRADIAAVYLDGDAGLRWIVYY